MVMQYRESTFEVMTPVPNGVNQTFSVSSEYVSGSLRLVVNGQIYEPNDELFGWSESLPSSITFDVFVPESNDVLEMYYKEFVLIPGAHGSPFHPNDTYP